MHVLICDTFSKPHILACATTYINSFNPIDGGGWWTSITYPQAVVAATMVGILVLAVIKCCKPENSAALIRTNN